MRNLFEATSTLLIVESMVSPYEEPSAVLTTEPEGEDKALRGIAFVPTENCLVKMCYRVGFSDVYKPESPLNNKYYRETILRKRQRTILVASKSPSHLSLARGFVRVDEPQRQRPDLWQKKQAYLLTKVHAFYENIVGR